MWRAAIGVGVKAWIVFSSNGVDCFGLVLIESNGWRGTVFQKYQGMEPLEQVTRNACLVRLMSGCGGLMKHCHVCLAQM